MIGSHSFIASLKGDVLVMVEDSLPNVIRNLRTVLRGDGGIDRVCVWAEDSREFIPGNVA